MCIVFLFRLSIVLLTTLLLATADEITNSQQERQKQQHNQNYQNSQTISDLEVNLLSLLGLKKRPKSTGLTHVPEELINLYIKQKERNASNFIKPGTHIANTIRSFVHAESEIDERFPITSNRYRLFFNVSSIPPNEILYASELLLSRKPDEFSEDQPKLLQLTVYDIIRPGISGKVHPLLRLIDAKFFEPHFNSTIHVDILPAVKRWLSKSNSNTEKSNHGILLKITPLTVTSLSSSGNISKKISLKSKAHIHDYFWLKSTIIKKTNRDNWKKLQPILYTYTDDGLNKKSFSSKTALEKRSKRENPEANTRRRKLKNADCKRHSLYIDFTTVGWNDWIVAPPGYNAFYCYGNCPIPIPTHLNSTNHAVVQNIIHSVNPVVPKACCIPTALSPISLLYVDDEDKVVLKNYEDMSVESCGCR